MKRKYKTHKRKRVFHRRRRGGFLRGRFRPRTHRRGGDHHSGIKRAFNWVGKTFDPPLRKFGKWILFGRLFKEKIDPPRNLNLNPY